MSVYGNNRNRIPNPLNPLEDLREAVEGLTEDLEAIGMLGKDVVTEGEKRGWSRAAKEYEDTFNNLTAIADKIVSSNEMSRESLDAGADNLIDRLEILERQVDALVEKVRKRIPPDELGAGPLSFENPNFRDYLNDYYHIKKQEMMEAEQKGYEDGREFYEKAIAKKKEQIAGAKTGVDETLQELYLLICDVIDDIAKRQMEIAELTIFLQGGRQ